MPPTTTVAEMIVQFRANSAQFNAEIDKARDATEKSGRAAHGSGQQFARFTAILGEQFFPALQGARVVMEGVVRQAIALGSQFGTIGLVAAGAAAVVGGVLYLAFSRTKTAAQSAMEGVHSLDESIQSLEKSIASSLTWLERLDTASRTLGAGRPALGETGFGRALDVITGKVLPFFRGRQEQEVKGARELVRELEGAKLLEDPAAGPAGKIATAQREAAAKSFFELEKAIKEFTRSSQEAAVTDPLEKMLIADFKRTQDLINKLRELPFVAQTVQELEAEIADRMKLIGELGAAGGAAQIAIREQASKAAGPGVATSLGLGPTNLITGFAQIEKLEKDIAGFRSEIERLTKLGVPARDLFDQIAEGQQKVDEQLQDFKTRFAGSPALLARVLGLEKTEGQGALRKALDDTVRGFNNLTQGSIRVEDEMGNLIGQTTGLAEANNFLAGILNDDIPTAMQAAGQSMVIVTGNVNDLARAVANARFELGLLLGESANIAPPGPGNI